MPREKTAPARPGRGRLLVARLALVLLSSVFAIALAEGITRWVLPGERGGEGDDEWRRRYRHMNETLYRRSSLDGLVYEPRPSSSVEMEYGTAAFDAARRRSDGTEPDTSAERVEVAVVGDSLVWGEFLAYRDAVPAQTEAILGGGAYRVSNFGVTGYDTAQEAIYYEAYVRPHAPDVVVVVFCLNDLFIASGPYGRFGTEAELAQKDAQDRMFDRVARVRRETLDGVAQAERADATLQIFARLRALHRRATFDDHYVDEYTIAAADPSRLAAMRAALSRLGAAIRADGATPLLVISPILESWDRYHWAAVHDEVRRAAEAAGFAVQDPIRAWRGAEDAEAMRAPGDNVHYSREGAGVLARVVAEAVRAARVVP